MRILLVNDYQAQIAGTEIYMWSLKDELEKNGHLVQVFGSNKNKTEYIKSQSEISIGFMLKRIFNLHSYLSFKKVVSDFKPDIIHLHNIFYELSPSILLATRNIPTVMTVHDNQIVNAVSLLSARTGKECKTRICGGCTNCVGWKGAIYEKIKRSIHKIFLKRIRLFITPSKYMADLIFEAGFKPVKVIPNGIQLLPYSKITNFNNLLYIGRLSKDKGVDYLIKAMDEVIKKIPNVQLQIVGDGPEEKFLKELTTKLELNKNIHFTGSVDKKDIEKYYKNSTVVVVPSISPDNFPTVCLEAMSVGRPMIGTAVGGIEELVINSQNGILINSHDYKNLSICIIKLLNNRSQLSFMSENAKQMSKEFALKTNVDKLSQIYSLLIKTA